MVVSCNMKGDEISCTFDNNEFALELLKFCLLVQLYLGKKQNFRKGLRRKERKKAKREKRKAG